MIQLPHESMRDAFRWAYLDDDRPPEVRPFEVNAVLSGGLLHVTPMRGDDDDLVLAKLKSRQSAKDKRRAAYMKRMRDFDEANRRNVWNAQRIHHVSDSDRKPICHFCKSAGVTMTWRAGSVGLCQKCTRRAFDAGELRDTILVLEDLFR